MGSFIAKSVGGNFNNTTAVSLLQGFADRRCEVKTIIVNNRDTVNHDVTLSLSISGTSFTMFKVTLAPGDTLVQDVPIVLNDDTYLLKGVLDSAASVQPQFVLTYAEVS